MADFPPGEEGGVYADSSIDPAMKNAFTQTRKWMMAKYDLTEFETWTIITQAVNFGMTQLVDGNWGMHALIPKSIFDGVERNIACDAMAESPIEDTGEEEEKDIDEETEMSTDTHSEEHSEEHAHSHDHDHTEEQSEDSGVGHNGLGPKFVFSLGLLSFIFVTIL